eukprot:15162278-Alexandrium_andersonii.AAC.1
MHDSRRTCCSSERSALSARPLRRELSSALTLLFALVLALPLLALVALRMRDEDPRRPAW